MLCPGSGFRLASLLPGLLLERHFATAQTFAGVLSGIFAATALTLAGIVTLAGMFFGDRAVTHARAGIVSPFSLGFAGVQTAADVFVLQQQGRVVIRLLVGCVSNQRCAEEHSAEGRHCQSAEVAPRQTC